MTWSPSGLAGASRAPSNAKRTSTRAWMLLVTNSAIISSGMIAGNFLVSESLALCKRHSPVGVLEMARQGREEKSGADELLIHRFNMREQINGDFVSSQTYPGPSRSNPTSRIRGGPNAQVVHNQAQGLKGLH